MQPGGYLNDVARIPVMAATLSNVNGARTPEDVIAKATSLTTCVSHRRLGGAGTENDLPFPTYVLSHPQSDDRRQSMSERLEANGAAFTFVDAIDAPTQIIDNQVNPTLRITHCGDHL